MKLTIEIHSEGGPIDACVALAKRGAKAVVKKVRVLRQRVRRAMALPPPVLPTSDKERFTF